MTKKRQADVLKKQQEKDKAKAQAAANKDKPDKTNRPRSHRSKGKASHPDQIKSSNKGRKTARRDNNNILPDGTQTEWDTQDEDILIGDEDIAPDGDEDPLGPDKIGFYTFFLEGQGNAPDLMGVDDDQLLVIQNDLRERLKARDEARERVVTRKLHELEQKHEFANSKFLKHFAQVSELLELTVKDGQAKVKPADRMLMILTLFVPLAFFILSLKLFKFVPLAF